MVKCVGFDLKKRWKEQLSGFGIHLKGSLVPMVQAVLMSLEKSSQAGILAKNPFVTKSHDSFIPTVVTFFEQWMQ